MTATAFVTATLAGAAVCLGVWLVMGGAFIAIAGTMVIDADRQLNRRVGVAMIAIGLTLFVAGTIAGVGFLA